MNMHGILQGLLKLAGRYPVIDIRGRGLMCAVEFGGRDGSMTAEPGVASAITKAASKRNMLLLTAGPPFALSWATLPLCTIALCRKNVIALPDEFHKHLV